LKELKEIINFWLVVIISTIALIGFVIEGLKINKLITYFEKQHFETSKIIANNLQATLLFESVEDFNSLTNTFDFKNDYISIEVWDSSGKLFASKGKPILDKLKESTKVKLEYSYIITQTSIDSSGKNFGKVVIKRSSSELSATIKNELLFSFSTLICISIFFMFAGRKLSEEVVVPINGLNEQIKEILKSHDLSVKIPQEHRILETKELSDSFTELIRDLLDSKRELEEMNLNLEELVENKTEKLSSTLKDMKRFQAKLVSQEKLASLGSLAAGIAHEIKNPLNLIQNSALIVSNFTQDVESFNLKLKERDYTDNDLEFFIDDINDVKMSSRIIMDNCKRADNIIKSMLSQSRSDKSKISQKLIESLIDQSVNLCFHAMRAKKNPIDVEIIKNYQENIVINCYPDDLERSLINIIDNSFYAMQERKQIEKGTKFSAILEVSLTKNESFTVIKIKDNGIGIDQKLKEKVLEPFFTTKPTGSGTGLGMSMVNDVAIAHNGELIVNSIVNDFTEVSITISNKLSQEDV